MNKPTKTAKGIDIPPHVRFTGRCSAGRYWYKGFEWASESNLIGHNPKKVGEQQDAPHQNILGCAFIRTRPRK